MFTAPRGISMEHGQMQMTLDTSAWLQRKARQNGLAQWLVGPTIVGPANDSCTSVEQHL